MLVPSEKADNLMAGVIPLTSSICHPGPISISRDSASGFVSLAKGDKQLQALTITIATRDKFNKNFNAVVNHMCQELEEEISKQCLKGGKISQSQLRLLSSSSIQDFPCNTGVCIKCSVLTL